MKKLLIISLALALGIATIPVIAMQDQPVAQQRRQRPNLLNVEARMRALEAAVQNFVQEPEGGNRDARLNDLEAILQDIRPNNDGYATRIVRLMWRNKIATVIALIATYGISHYLVSGISPKEMCDIIMGPARMQDYLVRGAIADHCERMVKTCATVFGGRFCNFR